MNFLAHLYLSGNHEGLMVGNFMADQVKGSILNHLPDDVRAGVMLHRKIDHFTDNHPVVALSKTRMRPRFGKYAPVVADLYYDHFLASLWENYSSESLHDFSNRCYDIILQHHTFLPTRTYDMLKNYMIPNNWLVTYASLDGIGRALTGMSRRARFPSGMEFGGEELQLNYENYRSEFLLFFEELRLYVGEEIASGKIIEPRSY